MRDVQQQRLEEQEVIPEILMNIIDIELNLNGIEATNFAPLK